MMAIYTKGVQVSGADTEKTIVNNARLSTSADINYAFTLGNKVWGGECESSLSQFSCLAFYGHRMVFQWAAPATNWKCETFSYSITVSPAIPYQTEIVIKSRDYGGGELPKNEWGVATRSGCWFGQSILNTREWVEDATSGWQTFTAQYSGNPSGTGLGLGHHYGHNGRKYPATGGGAVTYRYEVWVYSIGGEILPYDAIPGTSLIEVKFGE
jgi:hypothetical protein